MRPNFKPLAIAFSIVGALVFTVVLAAEVAGPPATDLKLAPDLSFTDDSSPNFPIAGKNLSDGSVAADHATVIFFGTRIAGIPRAKRNGWCNSILDTRTRFASSSSIYEIRRSRKSL